MNAELKMKVKAAILSEIDGLLDEHMDGIDSAMCTMMMDADGTAAFKYPVAFGVKLEPIDGDVKVVASLRYNVSKKDESVGLVASLQPDLFSAEVD